MFLGFGAGKQYLFNEWHIWNFENMMAGGWNWTRLLGVSQGGGGLEVKKSQDSGHNHETEAQPFLSVW